MSEQTTGTAGGFQGDPTEAFNPAPGTGCCGSPAANTGTTAAEEKAEDACCGAQAKAEAEAVTSGTSCCG